MMAIVDQWIKKPLVTFSGFVTLVLFASPLTLELKLNWGRRHRIN